MILTGKNLGERQKDLNMKVSEAAKSKQNFEDVKDLMEISDVDKLFKIDLASSYKNVEYLIDILKGGDSLYISRALKCAWLYDDEYENVINPDNIHDDIFPFMSKKMQRKFLSTISRYVSNERAISFYKYCKATKLTDIAFKFLIFTTESFKLEMLKEPDNLCEIKSRGKVYGRNFIGNSFVLAETYLNGLAEVERIQYLREFTYLYSISDVTYLDLLEKFKIDEWHDLPRLGLRVSKDIMKRHKQRIFNDLTFYLNIISKTALVKYSTSDDIKLYAELLPPKWILQFYGLHHNLVDLIPHEERLQFFKNIFNQVYPYEEFKISSLFYSLKYYTLLTPEEREAWALRQLENDSMLGGNDPFFVWYKFVSFEKAFDPIKKRIMITKDADKKANMIEILVKSATKDEDLECLFNYYYERHINEQRHLRENFIDNVLATHNVYNFTYSCWIAFEKLLYSLDVYNNLNYYRRRSDYRNVSLIYYVVNGRDIPDILMETMDSDLHSLKQRTYILSIEKQDIVFKFIFEFYSNRFFDAINNVTLTDVSFEADEEKKPIIRRYVNNILNIMSQFNKPEKDIPDIIIRYLNLHSNEFESYLLCKREIPEITQDHLLRVLKKDANRLISNLPQIMESFTNRRRVLRLGKLLQKLKVYFSNDITKDYVDFCMQILSQHELNRNYADHAVFGIFQLADDTFKIELMTEYAPAESKLDYSTIDPKLLNIQRAICSLAFYSRPPVPLANILSYIKADYIHNCLPMFNSYLAKLPLPLRMKFVKSVIDAPLSVQKHGLRSAFECFGPDDLAKLVTDVWQRTKNVSLRAVVYKELFNKILRTDSQEIQKELYGILKTFTLDLYEDDDHHLFGLLASDKLPTDFTNDYLQVAWKVVDKLPDEPDYIQHRTDVIRCIKAHMPLVENHFLESIIDDHINSALDENEFCPYKSDLHYWLFETKWQLTAKYLVSYTGEEESARKMEFLQVITKRCFKMWHIASNDHTSAVIFFYSFIKNLEIESYSNDRDVQNNVQSNIVFEQLLKDLEGNFDLITNYETIWDLKLGIITRRIILDAKLKMSESANIVDFNAVDESINTFVKEFINLVQVQTDKRILYTFAFSQIASLLNQCLEKLYNFVQEYVEFVRSANQSGDANMQADAGDRNSTYSLHETKHILVLICAELVEIPILESYRLALQLLPSWYDGVHRDRYLSVRKKIKSFDNGDLQYCYYKTFGQD